MQAVSSTLSVLLVLVTLCTVEIPRIVQVNGLCMYVYPAYEETKHAVTLGFQFQCELSKPIGGGLGSRSGEGAAQAVECFHDQRTRMGLGSADGGVPAFGPAERARTPRGSEEPLKESRLPPEGTARSQDRRGHRRGGPPDRRVAGLPGLEEAPSPHEDASGDLPYHQRCTRTAPYRTPRSREVGSQRSYSQCTPVTRPSTTGSASSASPLVHRCARRGTWLVPSAVCPPPYRRDPRDAVGRDPQTTRLSISWLGD